MLHLCRAYSFWTRQMFAEAADEFDVALRADPESLDLLSAAIQAHRRTGNSLRVGELKHQLPAKSESRD
jgi:hypothetical protein